jgi:hypothetical protein
VKSPEEEVEYEFPRCKEPGQHSAGVRSHRGGCVVGSGMLFLFTQDPPKAVQRLLGQELNGICYTKANLNRGGKSIQSKFDPASQIRMQEKNVGVQEGRSDIRRKRAEVEDDQALQEPKGIRIPRRRGGRGCCADQVDLRRAVRYWVRRHVVLKPRWPVPNGRGSNRRTQ